MGVYRTSGHTWRGVSRHTRIAQFLPFITFQGETLENTGVMSETILERDPVHTTWMYSVSDNKKDEMKCNNFPNQFFKTLKMR